MDQGTFHTNTTRYGAQQYSYHGSQAGTLRLSALGDAAGALRAGALYLPALLLVAAGAFTKSAQFPFHFWLPGAMAAPSPVSAYLHSATMVKAGIYLLARLNPALGGTDAWHYLVILAGTATLVTGAVLAYGQTDLKRLLAFTTVSALGTLTLLVGISTELSARAAMVFLLVHALYKAALFLGVGAIDLEAGTRDVRLLGGLARAMPLTAFAVAADQKRLGKVLGKDLDEGKVTLPLNYLMRKAEPAEQEALRNILHADAVSEADLAYTMGLMAKQGAVDGALRVAQTLSDEAKASLGIFPDSPARQALMALADYVVQREM